MRDRKSDTYRRLTEAEQGRKLHRNEVVDHVDEDKANNARSNRRVMSRSEHSRMHGSNRGLSKLRSSLRMVRERKKLY